MEGATAPANARRVDAASRDTSVATAGPGSRVEVSACNSSQTVTGTTGTDRNDNADTGTLVAQSGGSGVSPDSSDSQGQSATPDSQADAQRSLRESTASSRLGDIQLRLQQLSQYQQLTSSEKEERKQLKIERKALQAYVSGDLPTYQKWVDDHRGPDADELVRQIMADRDNPAAGALASHFNWGSQIMEDALDRDRDSETLYHREHPDGGTMWQDTKHEVGNYIGANVPAFLGMRKQNLDAVAKAEQARQLIGNLTNVEDVKDVIAALPSLMKTLDAGGNIVPPADVLRVKQKIDYSSPREPTLKELLTPGAGETTQFGLDKSGIHLSLTLGEAQAYLNALRENDSGANGSVFGNTFLDSLPLVTSGDIAIDENDKQQMAQRAALSIELAKEISLHHGGMQTAGAVTGGIVSFVAPEFALKNLGVVGKLGKALNEIGAAKSAEAGVEAISKATTIAFLAETSELKSNPQSQSMLDNLTGAAGRAFVMATSMKVGGAVENALTPTEQGLGAVPRIIVGAGASGAGMTVGNATQRAMEGQNPADIGGGEYGANAGLGLGMSLIRFRGVNGDPAFQQAWKARDAYINALTVSDRTAYDPTKAPPSVGELMAREAVLRQKLDAARGYEEQDPIKGQLIENLAAQNAALRPAVANPNAQPMAQAAAGSGSGSTRASGNTDDPAPASGGGIPSAGATPTNAEGGGAQPSSNENSKRSDSKDYDGVKAKQKKDVGLSGDQANVTDFEDGEPDEKPRLDSTLPVSPDKLSEDADTGELSSESESSNEPSRPPKRMNVDPSGHHVPAIRKMIRRSFEINAAIRAVQLSALAVAIQM